MIWTFLMKNDLIPQLWPETHTSWRKSGSNTSNLSEMTLLHCRDKLYSTPPVPWWKTWIIAMAGSNSREFRSIVNILSHYSGWSNSSNVWVTAWVLCWLELWCELVRFLFQGLSLTSIWCRHFWIIQSIGSLQRMADEMPDAAQTDAQAGVGAVVGCGVVAFALFIEEHLM